MPEKNYENQTSETKQGKFVHYKRNRNCFVQRMEKNRIEEETLESKISEIKLKTTGTANSIDINVKRLSDDKDVFFAIKVE